MDIFCKTMHRFLPILFLFCLFACDYSPSIHLIEKDVRRLEFPNPSGIACSLDDSLFYFVNNDSNIIVTDTGFRVKDVFTFPSKYNFQSIFADKMFLYVITSRNLLLKINKKTNTILKEVNLNKIIPWGFSFRTLFFNPFSQTFTLINYGSRTFLFELRPIDFKVINKYRFKKIQFISSGIQVGDFAYIVSEKSRNIYKMKLNDMMKILQVRSFGIPNVVGIAFHQSNNLILLSRELRRVFIFSKIF